MKTLLERTRYITLIAVVTLIVLSVATFVRGAIGTVSLVIGILSGPDVSASVVETIKLVDLILLGTVLLVFALGLYELFCGELALPAWLTIHDLRALKRKLADVVSLIIAIKFLEALVEIKNTQDLLFKGLASAAMILALAVFSKRSDKVGEAH